MNSDRQAKRNVWLILTLFAIAVLLMNWRDPFIPRAREITIVAKNMTFTMVTSNGDTLTNPDLLCLSGERVTFNIHNEDPGMKHDFTIPDLKIKTQILDSNQSARLTVKMPTGPAAYTYHCTQHQTMMNGTIVINDKKSDTTRLMN